MTKNENSKMYFLKNRKEIKHDKQNLRGKIEKRTKFADMLRSERCKSMWILQISSRAFQGVFACKIGVDTAEKETLKVWKWFWRAVGNLDILDPLRKSCSNSKILRSEMRAQETRSSMASKVNRRCEPSSSHFIVTLSSLLHNVKIFFICSRFMPRTFLLSQR